MLDKCPQCDYSLTGLPANHVCPECGLPYDDKSQAYGHGKLPYLTMAGVGVALWLAGRFTFDVVSGGSRTVGMVIGVLAMVSISVFVAREWRLYRRGLLAVVLPGGLYVHLPNERTGLIPWKSLAEPVRAVWYRTVQVSRTDRGHDLKISGVFRNKSDVERLRSQIEERIVATYPAREAAAKYFESK